MAQVKLSYNKLINMAKQYGVEKNALFIAAANQYVLQQQVLERIKASLDEEDECTVSKEYVKGRANVYVNPLLKELPKQSDSANKTLQTMLDIITKLGHEHEEKNETLLGKLMAGDDVDV